MPSDLRKQPQKPVDGLICRIHVADRRTPLRRFAEATGLGEFYALGQPREGRDDNPSLGTGAYALDQSWHVATSMLVGALAAHDNQRPSPPGEGLFLRVGVSRLSVRAYPTVEDCRLLVCA